MQGMLGTLDWAIIAAYFSGVFGVAIVSSFRAKSRETSAGYFLAGRNAGWFVIGASLFASNIGSEHLVGLAGSGASSGVSMGQFEVQASLMILALGWIFVPFYIRSGVYTMPEFMERRYGPAARWYLAVICIIGYVLTKISVTIYAGGIVFESLMGIDFWLGACIVVAATGIYTIFGGLRAVLYTDMFQMFVLIAGSTAVTFIGLREVGGWSAMCEIAGPRYMSMWHPISDPDFPWTAVLFGAPILGIWYWCTDQFIVQRVLSAPTVNEARRGALFAGFLKQLPLFLFVIPGVLAFCLVQQGKLELDVANDSNQALPVMVGALLPVGLRGLVVGGLLAALMSSLSSVFNSCSTLVTWDIYKKLHPQAGDRQLIFVGQVSTAVMVVLGMMWIPFMQLISGELYKYLQSVQAYISPPITAVFLLGVFWRRVNARGAMAALLTGFVLGMGRLVLELTKGNLAEGGVLYCFATVHFLHFSLGLFLVCCAVLVAVSLVSPPKPRHELRGLTFQTQTDEAVDAERGAPWEGRLNAWLTVALLALVGAVWWYFS